MVDLLLVNGTLIDEKGDIYPANIAINQGVIVDISTEMKEAKTIIDCKDLYISPSFVNPHAHSAMSLLKGLAEDVDIESWFNDYVWQYEQHLEGEDVYHGSLLAFKEMINYGITVVADHYLFADDVIRAAKDVKINLDMAPTIFSLIDVDKALADSIALHEKYLNDENICVSLGAHSPYTVEPSDLGKIARCAIEHNIKVHIHIAETEQQVREHREKYGESPVETLERTGILKAKTVLAHALVLSEQDEQLLGENLVAYCPKTYLKLAMPLENCYQHNLNYSFATDGAVSNNSLSVVEQAELFALFGKNVKADASVYDLKTMWQRLMNAHKYFDFNTGALEVGKRADLLLWDFNNAETAANYNPLASILYQDVSKNIKTVLSNGNIISDFDVSKSIAYAKKRKMELTAIQKKQSKLKF